MLVEPCQDAGGSSGAAIAAVFQLLEEVALPEGAHRDREMRHALVLGQRVSESDEGVLLFHADRLADTG